MTERKLSAGQGADIPKGQMVHAEERNICAQRTSLSKATSLPRRIVSLFSFMWPRQPHILSSLASLPLVFLFYNLSPITCPLAFAQTETATISGLVTDESGAVVPGAEVKLKSEERGTFQIGTTNNSGIYVFASVQPGQYQLLVQKAGFKQVDFLGLIVNVQDHIEQNFRLQVGSVSESVTVEANGLNINTTDATVSTTVDRNFAANLPLNGRSFQTLILLTPGTVPTAVLGNGGTFSVNGQRANANGFSVDGVSANLGGFQAAGNLLSQFNGANPNFTVAGTTQGMVSVDALQEFRIQTSTYAPEFGRQPGGQVSLLTRSGTNDFHGSVFDYLRNTAFDANNWFNDQQGLPKGIEHQNDFGGTLGGRIIRDRTFGFFSYEGLRLLQPETVATEVPSLRIRQEAALPYQAILNSWPIPQGPELTDSSGNLTGAAPYTLNQSHPTSLDSYSIRVDQSLEKHAHLFGRYSTTSSQADSVASTINNIQTYELRSRGLTLGTDEALRTNVENEFRFNYRTDVFTRVFRLNLIAGAKAFDTSVLFPAPFVADRDGAFWELSLPESDFFTAPGPNSKLSQRQVNAIDNVSHVIGSHQLKAGVDYRRLFPIYSSLPGQAYYGIFSEDDLKHGIVSQAQSQANVVVHPIYTNFSAYMQDTWRVAKRLTLTYGLRWEFNPAPGERDGIQPYNLIGLSNPQTATLAPLNSALYKTTYDNFAPRIGVAYQLKQSSEHELVVRGGFGMFYDLNSETSARGFALEPFQNQFTLSATPPFPLGPNELPLPPVPAPSTPPYSQILAVDPNLQLPYTLQWNVSAEQGLGPNQSLTVSYVGSSGRRLLRGDSLYNFNPNFTNISVFRNVSSSNYEALQLQFERRLTRGLQALASYSYSHSIDNASSTAGGTGSASTSTTGSDFPNPDIDRGNSDFDLRHAFRGAVTYNLPSLSSKSLSKAILGGWSLDTIGLVQTGLPVNLQGGRYRISGFNVYLRPNLVEGQPLYLHGAQCAAAHGGAPCPGGMGFNPGAFVAVAKDSSGHPVQEQGTLGRNVLGGFGLSQMDFAVHRQFDITEQVRLQFRSEFFNVFNHPNFGNINSVLGQGTFGLSQSTLNRSFNFGLDQLYQIGGPRSIQFALKLVF